MEYCIREIKPAEYAILPEFLYEAIFLREGETPPPRSIVNEPELRIYYEDFGKPDDRCLCAEKVGKVIGAVWVRNIDGYGSVDSETPEFAVSVLKEFRGQGIGTVLMQHMLENMRDAGCCRASLAVQKDNYAFEMYRKLGFRVIGENDQEYIMIYVF